MALSRIEDFDPNYRNRLGGDIQSFEVYTNTNQPVGRVVDAWVDDIGNIQQLVIDLNAPPPGNRVMLPLSQAQIDRTTRRIYVDDLPQLQTSPTYTNQEPLPSRRSPSTSAPGYQVASLEQSAPLEGYPIEPVDPQPSARRVELPDIPPDAYSDRSQPTHYTQNTPIPPTHVQRETYSQGYAANPPVPPLDVHQTRPSAPMPRGYESEQPPVRYEEVRQNPMTYSEGMHDRTPEYPKVVDEETFQALEERLVVDHHVRKAGEVIVRKEIETEIVEVPVKREKLIVEQAGAEPRQLAEIDLHEDPISNSDISDQIHERRQTRKRLD